MLLKLVFLLPKHVLVDINLSLKHKSLIQFHICNYYWEIVSKFMVVAIYYSCSIAVDSGHLWAIYIIDLWLVLKLIWLFSRTIIYIFGRNQALGVKPRPWRNYWKIEIIEGYKLR